jgi:flagellar biosynthesis protein FlhG
LANFDFDQAEGLRRMLAGPKPRIITFLSATNDDDKSAMLVNLGASLVGAGSDVILLDACVVSKGVASWLGVSGGATLLDVARQERTMDEVIRPMAQGFRLASLTRDPLQSNRKNPVENSRLANAFNMLVAKADVVVVDGDIGSDESFPTPAMASGEIVIQVSANPTSIKMAYSMIKRLNSELGRRPFGVLVTGASDREANVIYGNMAQAASRYLAIQLNSMGSVPADEHVHRAARLGRSVIDAYPLAGASVAFRRLAGRFAIASLSSAGQHGLPSNGANIGT